MNLLYRLSFLILITLLCSCESDILFTESQPSGVESQIELPEKFIGSYLPDVEKMSEQRDEPLPKNLPLEGKLPFFIVTADSIFFLEVRYNQVHENLVDGVSYELRDQYLFRDNKQISDWPVEKRGDEYSYVTRIDSFPIGVALDTFKIEMGEETTDVGFSQIKSYDNYFVLNFFSFETNYWASFYFGLTSENQLVIKIADSYDNINYTKIKAITKTERTTEKYILSPKDNFEFKKIADSYFKDVLFLKKLE